VIAPLAHVGAVPVEELAALAPAAGTLWFALRAQLSSSRSR
jgi:hypothetical protein